MLKHANNIKTRLTGRQGFTLIENVMYIAFITILAGVFIGFGTQMTDIREKARIVQIGNNNKRVTTDLIRDKIKEADSIIVPARGATSSELVMDIPNTADDIRFFLQDGILYVEENTEIVQVSSSALYFSLIEFMNVTDSVYGKDSIQIEAKVRAKNQDSVAYRFDDEYKMIVGIRR